MGERKGVASVEIEGGGRRTRGRERRGERSLSLLSMVSDGGGKDEGVVEVEQRPASPALRPRRGSETASANERAVLGGEPSVLPRHASPQNPTDASGSANASSSPTKSVRC